MIKKFFSFALPFLFLFCLMSLPLSFVEKTRREAMRLVSPLWEKIFQERKEIFSEKKETISFEQNHLALENELLNAQMEGIYEWLQFEQRIEEQIERLKAVSSEKKEDLYWNEFFRRRSEELRQILEGELQSLPAKIIFRDVSSWSSSLWINVGEKDNEEMGRTIVAKNSPVVFGGSLVGVVEFVGQSESRVRLITDSGLIPSVRASRGASQDRELAKITKDLIDRISSREDLFESPQEKKTFLNFCSHLEKKLWEKKEEWLLAKGELYGASRPFWFSRDQTLKGVGFHYTYPDEEGPARDLSGHAISSFFLPTISLLQKGDLLVTTGMDGVFPAGLHVAIVTKVFPLKEGDFSYEIEAKPTVSNLDDLSVVFVMPPLGFDRKESN